jgi:hypothetical protein
VNLSVHAILIFSHVTGPFNTNQSAFPFSCRAARMASRKAVTTETARITPGSPIAREEKLHVSVD